MHWQRLLQKDLTFNNAIDLACNRGQMCQQLAKRVGTKFKTIYGIDFNRIGFADFKQWGATQGCEVITRPSSLALEFADELGLETADFIGSKNAFYIISRKQVRIAMKNTARLLGKNSIFLFANSFVNRDSTGPGNFRHKWTPGELEKFLEECELVGKTEVLKIISSPDERYFHVVGGPQTLLTL